MTEENPLTEPKVQRSRGKRAGDGLWLVLVGAAGFALFLVIDSFTHIRIIPLAVFGILIALGGIAFTVMAVFGSGGESTAQKQDKP